jgi:hypothetical protein
MENCSEKNPNDKTVDVSAGRAHFCGVHDSIYGQMESSLGQKKAKNSAPL